MTTSWSGRRRPFPAATRRLILRAHPTCQLALPGCTGTSTIADHITGHADATAMGWTQDEIDDPANGQGVCPHCHNQKTQAEQARGRARKTARLHRPTEPHPGLIR